MSNRLRVTSIISCTSSIAGSGRSFCGSRSGASPCNARTISCLQLNMPALNSYPAAATAILIFAAVISLKVYQTPNSANLATVAVHAPVAASVENETAWSLSTPVAMRELGATPFRIANERAQTHRLAATPRYVLDSTPVSYDAALRF